jgi:sugar phosphate isomerase/epimerase
MNILVADWASFNQVLPLARDFGVGLEFQEFTHPQNLENPKDLVATIQAGCRDLPTLGIHGPFSELVPASRDPLVRQVAQARFSQAFDIMSKTNAQHLILHSGFFPKTYPHEIWIENTVNFWVSFLSHHPAFGLIHIENVYEDDYSTLLKLVENVNERIQHQALTICLDIGHVNANSNHSFEEWIGGLGDRIRYAHLHNNGGLLDDHWRLDRGTIQIGRVLALLQKHSPQALWCIETGVADLEPSLRWLQKEGYL